MTKHFESEMGVVPRGIVGEHIDGLPTRQMAPPGERVCWQLSRMARDPEVWSLLLAAFPDKARLIAMAEEGEKLDQWYRSEFRKRCAPLRAAEAQETDR